MLNSPLPRYAYRECVIELSGSFGPEPIPPQLSLDLCLSRFHEQETHLGGELALCPVPISENGAFRFDKTFPLDKMYLIWQENITAGKEGYAFVRWFSS